MSKSKGSASSSSKRIDLTDKLVVKDRESGWNDRIEATYKRPEYKAEDDKYCPRAQVRQFNEGNKMRAKIFDGQAKVTAKWVDAALKSKSDIVPLKLKPTLRAQAVGSMNAKGDSLAEVEILEKIIVRENLLIELHKLVENQYEITACLNEVVELVKAIRFQTVDIIEDIDAWLTVQISLRPFIFRGTNYLIKIYSDLEFLDKYEDIVEKYCFEFTGNPLGYKGGGALLNIKSGLNSSILNTTQHDLKKFTSYAHEKGSVDGVEIVRLRSAEKVIQREFDRMSKEKTLLKQYTPIIKEDPPLEMLPYPPMTLQGSHHHLQNHNQVGGNTSSDPYSSSSDPYSVKSESYGHINNPIMKNQIQDFHTVHTQNLEREQKNEFNRKKSLGLLESAENQLSKMNKSVPKAAKFKLNINPKRIKLERIAALTEESSELKAMQAHVEDQINVLIDDHKALVEKKAKLEKKKKEAVDLSRDAIANHLAVEIAITINNIQDISNNVKDLQRQSYFINLERIRKKQIAQKLHKDMQEEKARLSIQIKIQEKIRDSGIIAALKTLNTVSMEKTRKNIAGDTSSSITEERILRALDANSPSNKAKLDGGQSLANDTQGSFYTQYNNENNDEEASNRDETELNLTDAQLERQKYIESMMLHNVGSDRKAVMFSENISTIEYNEPSQQEASRINFEESSSDFMNFADKKYSKDYSSYRRVDSEDASAQQQFNTTEYERSNVYSSSGRGNNSNGARRQEFSFADERGSYDETNFEDSDRGGDVYDDNGDEDNNYYNDNDNGREGGVGDGGGVYEDFRGKSGNSRGKFGGGSYDNGDDDDEGDDEAGYPKNGGSAAGSGFQLLRSKR